MRMSIELANNEFLKPKVLADFLRRVANMLDNVPLPDSKTNYLRGQHADELGRYSYRYDADVVVR